MIENVINKSFFPRFSWFWPRNSTQKPNAAHRELKRWQDDGAMGHCHAGNRRADLKLKLDIDKSLHKRRVMVL